MSILGLDYGAKNIGLAIADEETRLPLPLKTVKNKGGDFVLAGLKKIIEEEQVKKIVVGLPVSLSGEKGPKAKEIEAFIDFLKKNLSVEIVSFDERFSSRLADALVGGAKTSRDIGAAMVILEDYIMKHVTHNT